MGNYIPGSDQDIRTWLTNFLAGVTTHAATLGLDVADITPLSTAKTDYSTALDLVAPKKAAARAAVASKDTAQDAAVSIARTLVKRIETSPNLTNAIRQELGINIPSERTPSVVGVEVPGIYLEAKPGSVIIHFGTEPMNERINTKPSWAKGCMIYRKKYGDAEYTFLNFATTSPFRDEITGPAQDYAYVVRYRGTKPTDLGEESSIAVIAAGGQLAA